MKEVRLRWECPVLYLLHGIFGDEYSFPRDSENRLKEITANMAKDGLIEETIVVCPNMYASSDPQQQLGFTKEACLPYDRFIYDLTADLMPHIETTYSVRTGRENTYLAGFSMGGRETIYITLKRPELFGYVCAISAAPGIIATKDAYMTHEGMMSGEEMRFADGAVLPERNLQSVQADCRFRKELTEGDFVGKRIDFEAGQIQTLQGQSL